MDRIRELINKRKADAKFKRAGKGYRLDESAVPTDNQAQSSNVQLDSRDQQQVEEAKRRAAEAALKRLDSAAAKNQKAAMSRSQRSIMVEARRQLEACRLAESREQQKEAEEEPKPSKMASAAGVYFTCDLVGEDVCMEKQDLIGLMENRLRSCLAEEPLLTSSLMIKSLNPMDRCQVGVEVLCRYLDNVLNHLEEDKYKSIRTGNKVFMEKVVPLKGGVEFLKAAGFSSITEDNVEYLRLTQDTPDLEHLKLARDVLVSTEPIAIKLHRNPKIFKLDSTASLLPAGDELSSDFFRRTADEVHQEQKAKAEQVERLSTLRTQEMRKRDEHRYASRFMYTLIRIRFPDDWILQGVFNAKESLNAVRDFVQRYLSCDWLPFNLRVPTQKPFDDQSYDMSLIDLGLSPAALLRFDWDEGTVRDAAAAGRAIPDTYLKLE